MRSFSQKPVALPPRFLLIQLGSMGIAALACLIWLFLIPSDPKNALIGGFSPYRLALGGFLVLMVAACLGMIFQSNRIAGLVFSPRRWRRDWKWKALNQVLFALASLTAIIGLLFLLQPPSFFGDYRYAIDRLKPVLAWGIWADFQLILWAVIPFLWASGQGSGEPDAHLLNPHLAWDGLRQSGPVVLGGAFLLASLSGLILWSNQTAFEQIPELFPFLIILGACLVFLGLFLSPILSRLTSVGFALLLLIGIVLNIMQYEPDITRFRAGLHRIPADDAFTLGNTYHYTLSFYHILATQYPDVVLITTPGLFDQWNISEDLLRGWVSGLKVLTLDYEPDLTQEEAQKIMELSPVELKVNTLQGYVTYYFLNSQAAPTRRLILFAYDRQRFVISEDAYQKLFPEKADQLLADTHNSRAKNPIRTGLTH